jgi:hypothetical protein
MSLRARVKQLEEQVDKLQDRFWDLESYLGVERGYHKEKKED